MRDFSILREQLRLALLCSALGAPLAACGPSSAPPPDEPISNTPPDTTPRVDPNASIDRPWPHTNGSCDSGAWCGSRRQILEHTQQASEVCPEYFDHDGASFSIDRATTDARVAEGEVNTCCYTYYEFCGEGRPLLDGGHATVAPLREGGAWARATAPVDGLAPALRERLGRFWLDAARLEHASVASFARTTLELMALGAPPELLADCQRAGLDEVRHAELCFGLVERYLGRRLSPGPIAARPAREADLARLAVDTFVEGCVGETVATLATTRALAGCEDAEVAGVLRRIVRDETRHAALAWRTIAWAVAEGGDRVRAALHAQAARMSPAIEAGDVDDDDALVAHGRLDGAGRRAATLDAWRQIILPTLDEVTHA